MIVEYIRYRITTEPAEFEAAYAKAQASLEASPNCHRWELSRCHEEPDRYVLRIEWDSLEGHLGGFRKSAVFGPFLAAIRPFIGQIEEMQHYTPTAITGRGGAG